MSIHWVDQIKRLEQRLADSHRNHAAALEAERALSARALEALRGLGKWRCEGCGAFVTGPPNEFDGGHEIAGREGPELCGPVREWCPALLSSPSAQAAAEWLAEERRKARLEGAMTPQHSEPLMREQDVERAGHQLEDLLPCPCCGRKYPLMSVVLNKLSGNIGVRITCVNTRCMVEAHVCYPADQEAEARSAVAEKWNRREWLREREGEAVRGALGTLLDYAKEGDAGTNAFKLLALVRAALDAPGECDCEDTDWDGEFRWVEDRQHRKGCPKFASVPAGPTTLLRGRKAPGEDSPLPPIPPVGGR